ncbi:MAG: hypothetical protein J7K84_10650 [Deltaproteobacteria bacterium]|nr:hypothetical protein [Deltaproteobacteria bacterium]
MSPSVVALDSIILSNLYKFIYNSMSNDHRLKNIEIKPIDHFLHGAKCLLATFEFHGDSNNSLSRPLFLQIVFGQMKITRLLIFNTHYICMSVQENEKVDRLTAETLYAIQPIPVKKFSHESYDVQASLIESAIKESISNALFAYSEQLRNIMNG